MNPINPKNAVSGIATMEQIFAALVKPFSSTAKLMYAVLFALEIQIKATHKPINGIQKIGKKQKIESSIATIAKIIDTIASANFAF